MNVIGIIPARLASTRFPNKPLALIHGMPMIGHCYHRTKLSTHISDVYVATCDEEIFDYIISIGGKAVMTSNKHERCSDRTAEALEKIEKENKNKVDIVVMVQGDEPMVNPDMIDDAINPLLKDNKIKVVNLMAQMKSRAEHDDPNEVKVVVDINNYALYFSREPIPSWKKDATDIKMLKQVCIIPFERDYLFEYLDMEQTPLEIAESVDMNRILEHGGKIKMVLTEINTYAVDTEHDLKNVEKHMIDDQVMKMYKKD